MSYCQIESSRSPECQSCELKYFSGLNNGDFLSEKGWGIAVLALSRSAVVEQKLKTEVVNIRRGKPEYHTEEVAVCPKGYFIKITD